MLVYPLRSRSADFQERFSNDAIFARYDEQVAFNKQSVVFAAFLACLIPTRRATRVDPMEALHYE